MCAMYPTTSKKRFTYIKYGGHIATVTGKVTEAVSLEGIHTISDILSRLDKEYPGLKEIFMPPGGVFNSRTSIHIRRGGCYPGSSIVDEQEQIEDGDVLFLW